MRPKPGLKYECFMEAKSFLASMLSAEYYIFLPLFLFLIYRMDASWHHSAGWSSLVARRAHNPEVIGSNPVPATISVCRSEVKNASDLFCV